MSSAYDKLLNRLNAYRKMQNMSQESMGSVMGITQSHYSKVENGKKIISGEELHNLDMNGIDVDYLVSGIKSPRTVLDDLMEAAAGRKGGSCFSLSCGPYSREWKTHRSEEVRRCAAPGKLSF